MTTVALADYQEICERGRLAAESMDKGRFTIGDLACEIETVYGGHMIDDFAREVNIGKASVKAYRTVCRFYEPARRVDYLAENPNITYTHMRHAMRLETQNAAYAFLDECCSEGYTTDEAAYHLSKRLGNGVIPSCKAQGTFLALRHGDLHITLKTGVLSDLEALIGKEVVITIREATE